MTHLSDLQDAIQAAENLAMEQSEEHELPFASEWQVISVSILIGRCLTEPLCTFNPRKYVHRDIRIAVLSLLFQRDVGWFTTSRLISRAGARRLLSLAYGTNTVNYGEARTLPIAGHIVQAIQEAATGLFEAKYPNGKVVRKVVDHVQL